MGLKTGIWLSQLQKLDPPMDSVALYYFMLLSSSKAQKLLQGLCCSICFFLEGNRTAPFSMTEAGAVLVEGGFLACHEQKDINQEGFTGLLAASSLLYG